jgi:hypothetical protein
MATVNITDTELAKSAVQYQKELLMMPVIGAKETLQHMSGRPGTRGRVIESEISGDIEIGPYDPKRTDTSGVNLKPRTLETFLGSVIKEFDPNETWKSVFGDLITQGDALINVSMTKSVLMFLSAQLGKKLNTAIWNAQRKDDGTKTVDLFNGLDTITTTEKTAGTIAAANGNMIVIEAITSANAVDILKSIYFAASDELQGVATKMYIPRHVYNDYTENYKNVSGAVAYNTQYDKTFLEGSSNMCELVPLTSKKGSPYIHLSTQQNMRYGYGNGLAEEKITVEKYHPFVLDFVATMFFGTQFRSINKEMLMVATIDGIKAL